MRTVDQIIDSVCPVQTVPELGVPRYAPKSLGDNVAFAVPSMQHHMSDEGWQLMLGLKHAGYTLKYNYEQDGYRIDVSEELGKRNIKTAIIQDKREWDRSHNPLAFHHERFINLPSLKRRDDVFKLTVLKDSHQRPSYHRDSAEEINCHAWITYYHPKIVKHLAPYVRTEHLVRTYHSIDKTIIPIYEGSQRRGCMLSGAILGTVYPLRTELAIQMKRDHRRFVDLHYRPHPGYHNSGSDTPLYLKALSRFKVAICTTSIYGYSLRKLIEATACGCIVITDLPVDDQLPYIDDNMVRLQANDPRSQCEEILELLPELYKKYDPEMQQHLAHKACEYYDFREVGLRLANDIEQLRLRYAQN